MSALSFSEAERAAVSDAVEARLDELFSFEHGAEYPLEYPPGYAEPIDGPLTVDEHLEGAP